MTPAFRITVDGADITRLIADRLVRLTVVDEAGVNSDRVHITIDDRDQVIEIPSRGAMLSVAIGYTDRLVEKGKYVVEEVEIEGPDRVMTIRANAVGASKGSGAAKNRSWSDTTLGGIAASIASKHGWTVAISAALAGVVIDHEDQTENDLQFLSRLAAENDAVAKVQSSRLVIAPHGQAKAVSGIDLPRVTVRATDTSEWSWTVAERGQYSGVKATYNDYDLGDLGEAIEGEDTGNTHVLPYVYPSRKHAQKAAWSKRKTLKRGGTVFAVRSMPGDPAIEAETRLVAEGFRTGVDGEWTVVRAQHDFTKQRGYIVSIDCEAPQK